MKRTGPRTTNLFDQRKRRRLSNLVEDFDYLTARIRRNWEQLHKVNIKLVGLYDTDGKVPLEPANEAVSQLRFQMNQLNSTIRLLDKATERLENFSSSLENSIPEEVAGKSSALKARDANDDGCDDEILNLLKA
jgi:hypothetical protein